MVTRPGVSGGQSVQMTPVKARGGPCEGLCTTGGAGVGVDEGPYLEILSPFP